MTNSIKSVSRRGPSTLAVEDFDLPDTAVSSSVCLRTNVGNSGDHVIWSLSIALKTVELERDEHCAEALRQAIAARLVGLRPETRTTCCANDVDPNRRPTRALQKWRLKRVVEYVDANLSNRVSLLDLAAVAGLSRMHFASQFRVATGLRPHEFLLRRRIRRSKELLRTSPMAIVEIAFAVGFQTQAHFTTVFKRFAGHSPRQWRIANQVRAVQQTRAGSHSEMTAAI
jgi:transcriptional regulator GlxA family with amidase domain